MESLKLNCRTQAGKVFSNKQEPAPLVTTPPLDRRVQRTRQLLQTALFSLITERGYENITIQDITEQANLGRTTFYLHYQDKEELLKASVGALLHQLQLGVEPSADEVCAYRTRCVRIFQNVAEKRPLYQALLRETGPVNIGNMLRDYFVALFRRYVAEIYNFDQLPENVMGLIAVHAAGSLLGLVGWWLDQAEPFPAEQMGLIYSQLMSEDSVNLALAELV